MNSKTIERLEAMLKRSEQIEEELTKPEIVNDIKYMAALGKEQSQLTQIVDMYRKYKSVCDNLQTAKEMLNNEEKEMVELAKEDVHNLEAQMESTEEQIKVMLLPKDPNDEKNVIVEIHGAAGGDEGNIFAGDLFRMYSRYAEMMNWKLEVLETTESEAGGFSTIAFQLKGARVYSKMKFESGAHRVQRIPKTEAKGRVHTSTATVAVLPEVDDVEVEIKLSDLKIDTYRASGAGGQHVNTTDSAVRITHLPTGIVVTSQDGRSQHDNKALAMLHLRSKVYEEQVRKQNEAIGSMRKEAMGTGDRSEKIRTYNYPQNRVTDHRIGFTLNKLDMIMEGYLDEIITALVNEEQRLKLEGQV